MPAGGGLARLVDASAILSAEQQAHIAALHAQDTWTVDTAAATVTLTAPDGRALVCRAHFLGTSAPGPSTWLWGWRNINEFPAGFVALAERVRAAGEEQGVAELATAEIPLTDDLPRRVTIAAKTITGLAAHYSGPIGGGSRAWLLLEHPDLELPPPTSGAAADAILSAIETVAIADHREALTSWARRRGVALAADDLGGAVLRLTLTDGDVVVTFDEQHRITRVEEQALVGLDASAAGREGAAAPATEAEAGSEPSPVTEPEPAPAPAPEPVAEPRPEPAPVVEPEPLQEPLQEPLSEPPVQPQPQPQHEPEAPAEEPEPQGIEELLAVAEAQQAGEEEQAEPESPMRRLFGFLRGPKP